MKARDAAGLHALFNPDMQTSVPRDQVGPMLEQMVAQRGALVAVEPIEVAGHKGVYRLRAERGEWRLTLALDDADRIAGMLVGEAEEGDDEEPPVAKSELALGLPFGGEWFVVWGGDTGELNHHVDHRSQRRATDLVVVDATGASHRGDGKENADYFAYGKPVLAVADGRALTAVDGVPDNQPGEMNPLFTPGNLVVLDHGGGVYSAYAHLIPGSVRVKAGGAVKRGQPIGACGNSGNSSEPHLHFQLQDGPRFEKSWGIEPVFAGVEVTRDGTRTRHASYTWRKGDRVHAPK